MVEDDDEFFRAVRALVWLSVFYALGVALCLAVAK